MASELTPLAKHPRFSTPAATEGRDRGLSAFVLSPSRRRSEPSISNEFFFRA